MAVVYHEIYLPIDTESTFDYIVIKQGDAGTHRVRATLISNNRVYTIPTSGASYFMKFRKPDNNYCLVEATVSDNTINAEVTEEMLRVSGTGRGEFMIVSGSNELKTATFHVKIVKETYTSEDVQSHSDFAPFAALLQGAGAAASNANTAAAAANAAASLAEQKAQAIPDDYSDLVAEVAGKADQSNTYTKDQVDGLIEDVTVETDTTLAVSGAPADAAETGRQFGLINESLGAVGDSLQSQTGIISKVEGSYINLTTDPVSLTPVANALWSHSIVSCAEGDKFIINADGGQSPRAWGFLDSANHVLSVCDASTVVEDLELTAPTNAVKLIINDRSGAVSNISGAYLLTKIAESAQGKVDIQQSPGDYGKALVINRDGQVRPGVVSGGSGLTDNVKVALLACFKHVHWDDEHSVDYYDALEAALYAAESRLTAVIDYGNATLFEDDPLSKVRWMTKVYYDGVEISPGDCTFTGNLIAGQNVLTITYNDESTSIIVEAEEKPASRVVLTAGDLLKFNGWGMSSAADGHKPPYLVSAETARVYYSEKGHAPYMDENNTPVVGVYPVPIPADATHVRVGVAPNTYKVGVNCWKYNNSSKNYTFIRGTDTGLNVHTSETDIAQYPANPRALNVIVVKPDTSAIGSSEEPTQVVVQFT